MKSQILVVLLLLCAVVSVPVGAQEFINEQPYKISYDTTQVGYAPKIIYNGSEQVVFYFWRSDGDTEYGYYFRKLDENGAPAGPQKHVYTVPFDYNYFVSDHTVTWDGEAYVAFLSNNDRSAINIIRITKNGELMLERKIHKAPEEYITNDITWAQAIGDTLFYFFDAGRGWIRDSDSYMVRMSRTLKGPIEVTKLPRGGMPSAVVLGVTHDANNFLVMLGDRYYDDWEDEYRETRLLKIGFDGKMIGEPQKIPALEAAVAAAGDGIGGDFNCVAGPVYVGDGYVLATSREGVSNTKSTMQPYTVQGMKIDADGNLLEGPYKMASIDYGPPPYIYFSKPILVGNHIAFFTMYYYEAETLICYVGKKGKEIGKLSLKHYLFDIFGIFYWPDAPDSIWDCDQAYTGTKTTILKTVPRQKGIGNLEQRNVFSQQVSLPSFCKPSIFYFQAGTTGPSDNERLVIWSTVMSTSVKLTGPDFEIIDLPPVGSYMVDTGGEKTKLTLTMTTEDGKTISKKLTIK